jgi:hypothetical protein
MPEKLIQYAAETSALIHVLWALALIFFIALVNVSLMLAIAWMKDQSSKERERRYRSRLAERDRRIGELELAIQRMAELRDRSEAALRPLDPDPGPNARAQAEPAEAGSEVTAAVLRALRPASSQRLPAGPVAVPGTPVA